MGKYRRVFVEPLRLCVSWSQFRVCFCLIDSTLLTLAAVNSCHHHYKPLL